MSRLRKHAIPVRDCLSRPGSELAGFPSSAGNPVFNARFKRYAAIQIDRLVSKKVRSPFPTNHLSFRRTMTLIRSIQLAESRVTERHEFPYFLTVTEALSFKRV